MELLPNVHPINLYFLHCQFGFLPKTQQIFFIIVEAFIVFFSALGNSA